MRFSKPRAAAFLLSAVFLASVAPAQAQTAPKPVSIAFINPGSKGEVFWDMVVDTMHVAARQLDMSIEVLYAARDRRLTQDIAVDLAKREKLPDFLIIGNEESTGRDLLETANAVGLRTLLISSELTGADREALQGPRRVLPHWIGSLTPDMENAGARMASKLIDAARANGLNSKDGKLHILALAGDLLTQTSIARNSGFLRVVEQTPDVVLDRMLVAHWTSSEGEALTSRYLNWAQRKGIKPAGVWAGNDVMALGALKAVEKAGLRPGKDHVIVGLNWSPEALQRVARGEMLLTDGGHFLVGLWSMVLLRDFVDGCDFARESSEMTLRTAAVTQSVAPAFYSMIVEGDLHRIDVTKLRAYAPGGCRSYDFSLRSLLSAMAYDDERGKP